MQGGTVVLKGCAEVWVVVMKVDCLIFNFLFLKEKQRVYMYVLDIYSSDSERSRHASVRNAYGDLERKSNALQMRHHGTQHVTKAHGRSRTGLPS